MDSIESEAMSELLKTESEFSMDNWDEWFPDWKEFVSSFTESTGDDEPSGQEVTKTTGATTTPELTGDIHERHATFLHTPPHQPLSDPMLDFDFDSPPLISDLDQNPAISKILQSLYDAERKFSAQQSSALTLTPPSSTVGSEGQSCPDMLSEDKKEEEKSQDVEEPMTDDKCPLSPDTHTTCPPTDAEDVEDVDMEEEPLPKKIKVDTMAEYTFPVRHVHDDLREILHSGHKIHPSASRYMVGVLESLVRYTWESVYDGPEESGPRQLRPRDITLGFQYDDCLRELTKNVVIPGGGVACRIHRNLIPRRK